MSLLMLALWALATSHCGLEQVAGLEFLACCQHPGTAPHQDEDCTQDSCAVVETGHYKLEEHQASAPEPLWVLSLLTSLQVSLSPAASEQQAQTTGDEPEWSHTWQFFFRAALPPRAPSISAS